MVKYYIFKNGKRLFRKAYVFKEVMNLINYSRDESYQLQPTNEKRKYSIEDIEGHIAWQEECEAYEYEQRMGYFSSDYPWHN
jgi:hypothetical protein